MEKLAFSPGNATSNPKKLSEEDVSSGKDSYGGKYKAPEEGYSEAEKFGTNLNPVQNPPLPAKGLRGAGG